MRGGGDREKNFVVNALAFSPSGEKASQRNKVRELPRHGEELKPQTPTAILIATQSGLELPKLRLLPSSRQFPHPASTVNTGVASGLNP